MRPVDFAQAALIAGFIAVMWEEMVSRTGTVFNEDTAYRFGALFVAVLVVKWVLRKRSEPAEASPVASDPARPADSAKDPSP